MSAVEVADIPDAEDDEMQAAALIVVYNRSFRTAHPGHAVPHLCYGDGEFFRRHTAGGRVIERLSIDQFREMVNTLVVRAFCATPVKV